MTTVRNCFDRFCQRRAEAKAQLAELGATLARAEALLSQVRGDATAFARGAATLVLWQTASVRCGACGVDVSSVLWTGQRHHCRLCGRLFCSTHAPFLVPIDAPLCARQTLRACDCCFRLYRTRLRLAAPRGDADERVLFQRCFHAFCCAVDDWDRLLRDSAQQRLEREFEEDLADAADLSPRLEPILSADQLRLADELRTRDELQAQNAARQALRRTLLARLDALVAALPRSWSPARTELIVRRLQQRCSLS